MPITLITGTPGAGKTLYAVKMLIEQYLPTGRQIYTNINGLDVGNDNVHVLPEDGPMTWMSYPDGSLFFFDEVQTQYPFKNSMSKTPDYIKAYETHRHRGMDFVFITQGPYLLDRHLHPLIDRHMHVYRPFGLKRSTVLEWNGVNPNPAPAQSRSNALVKNFSFPKKYFDYYKSATVHTVKMRWPVKLIVVLFALLFAFGGLIYFAFFRIPDLSVFSDEPLENLHTGPLDEFGNPNPLTDPTGPPCADYVGRIGPKLYFNVRGESLVFLTGFVQIVDGVITHVDHPDFQLDLCV